MPQENKRKTNKRKTTREENEVIKEVTLASAASNQEGKNAKVVDTITLLFFAWGNIITNISHFNARFQLSHSFGAVSISLSWLVVSYC